MLQRYSNHGNIDSTDAVSTTISWNANDVFRFEYFFIEVGKLCPSNSLSNLPVTNSVAHTLSFMEADVQFNNTYVRIINVKLDYNSPSSHSEVFNFIIMLTSSTV